MSSVWVCYTDYDKLRHIVHVVNSVFIVSLLVGKLKVTSTFYDMKNILYKFQIVILKVIF